MGYFAIVSFLFLTSTAQADLVLAELSARSRIPVVELTQLLSNCEETQSSMNFCAFRDFVEKDMLLDATLSGLSGVCAHQARNEQSAWESSRDATCNKEADDAAEGGSMRPMVYSTCRTQVTAKRIDTLIAECRAVESSAAAERTLPAPPYAEIIESLPYGVKVRLLIAPSDARAAQRIKLLGANSYEDGNFYVTDIARVWEGFVYAKSNQSLSLRFKVVLQNSESEWSRAITTRTSPAWRKAPTAPSALAVETITPLAFRLTWADTALNEHGFEIERCGCGNRANTCVVIAYALPNTTSLRISGFLPNTLARFRIRAINPLGASTWSALAENTTPLLTTKLPPLGVDYYGWDNACTTLLALRESISKENSTRVGKNLILRNQPDKKRISMTQLSPRHPTVTVTDPRECGSAGCDFVVYGTANGCFRAISGGFREALELGDDWPILAARWHSNAVRFGAQYLQMIEGKYQIVDESTIMQFDGLPVCLDCKNRKFPADLPNAETGTKFNFDAYQCQATKIVPIPLLRAGR